ncbi:MAG: prepilin-type N-terminal cleavage/methylation domain-containing protein [bacterium]
MKRTGFTLIELLIVVAIIGILAAIAVPNFLNAQIRAKVSRVKSELRSFAVALDTYRVDHGAYPFPILDSYHDKAGIHTESHIVKALLELTTPVAYMSSVDYPDPFFKTGEGFWIATVPAYSSYTYVNYNGRWMQEYVKDVFVDAYGLASFGPDKYDTGGVHPVVQKAHGQEPNPSHIYDPSNGTVSRGDIVRYGGEAGVPFGLSD